MITITPGDRPMTAINVFTVEPGRRPSARTGHRAVVRSKANPAENTAEVMFECEKQRARDSGGAAFGAEYRLASTSDVEIVRESRVPTASPDQRRNGEPLSRNCASAPAQPN
jgi:hypothetical protein